MTFWRRKRRRPRIGDPWDLSVPLLQWTSGAPWTIGDACMGTQIFGATGAGKSTGSLRTILLTLLRHGFGGLFLTAKKEDAETYRRYVEAAGRLDDLLVFSPEHGLRLNFLADEKRQAGSMLGLVENLTTLLMTAAELLEPASQGTNSASDNGYFWRGSTGLARNSLLILELAQEMLTVPSIHRLILSAPQSVEEVRSEGWQKNSYLWQCLVAADKAPKTESQRADYEHVVRFFCEEWPALASRTRSSVQSTLTTTTDLLSRGAARDLLSSPYPNISPTAVYEGAIVLIDMSVHEYHDVGRLVQGILKFIWQRAHARRDVGRNPRPTFIAADESQYFLTSADQSFQAIARSTRTATIYATQSISGMMAALCPSSEHRIHSLLGNLQTRICHQSTDIRTIEYMQQLIGRSRQMLMSGTSPATGIGWRHSLAPTRAARQASPRRGSTSSRPPISTASSKAARPTG